MKNWKIRITLILSILLITSMLVSCGTSGGNDGGKTNAGTTPAAQEPKKDIVIDYYSFKVDITDEIKATWAEYEKLTGVKAEIQIQGNDYHSILATRFASGNEPDIFMVEPYTELWKYQPKLEPLTNEPWIKYCPDNSLTGAIVNGEIYGFPLGYEAMGVIYNKAMYNAAGITEKPDTWSEFVEALDKLAANGQKAYMEDYAEPTPLGMHVTAPIFSYFSGADGFGDYIEAISTGKEKLGDNPYVYKFLDLMDLVCSDKYGHGLDTLGVKYDTKIAAFGTGKTAQTHEGIWCEKTLQNASTQGFLDLGMYPIPYSENPEDNNLQLDVPGYFAINKNSKPEVKQACKDWLIWMHDEGPRILFDRWLLLPVFTDFEFKDKLSPLGKEIYSYVDSGRTIPWAFTLYPTGISQSWLPIIQSYISGEIDRETFVKEIQEMYAKHYQADKQASGQ